MRMLLAIVCLGAALCRANTASTDLSDIWWNPSESGWGVNIIHQNDTLFMTFFVYGQNNAPVWYVAPEVNYARNDAGAFVYSGAVYQTAGPWIGTATFNPNAVTNRQVGTVTARFDSIEAGAITYTVDGVAVTKSITRQTWRTNNISGTYLGATIGTYSGCVSNGYLEEPAEVTITATSSSMTIRSVSSSGTCTYTGTYSQAGRMGSGNGTYSCTNGARGSYRVYELEANISGLTARADAFAGGTCNWTGRIGGLRRGS